MTATILDQGGEMIVWTGWGILGLPMFALGLYMIATANSRRQRVEPFVGTESVA